MLLDEIDEQQYMAEMAVMDALMNTYMKEASMLEYCSEEVVQECFYQEGLMDDIKVGIKGVDGESVIKKILLFIPRLIASFVNWIRSKFSKDIKQSTSVAKQAVQEVSNLSGEQGKVYEAAEEAVTTLSSKREPPSDEECQRVAAKIREAAQPLIRRLAAEEINGKLSYKTNAQIDVDTTYHVNVDEATDIYVEKVMESVKTTASYLQKNMYKTSDRVRSSDFGNERIMLQNTMLQYHPDRGANYSTVYKHFAAILKSGKIPSHINIGNLNKIANYWSSILDDVDKAITNYDKGNQAKFQKDINTICEKYMKKSTKKSFITTYTTDTRLDSMYDMLVSYTENEFVELMNELYKILDNVQTHAIQLSRRCTSLYDDYEDSGDIGKHMKDLRSRRNDNMFNDYEKIKKNEKLDADEAREKIRKKYERSEMGRTLNAYQRISDVINNISSECRSFNSDIAIDLARYKTAINMARNIKGIVAKDLIPYEERDSIKGRKKNKKLT